MSPAEETRRIRPSLRERILLEYRYVDREIGGVLGLRRGEIICSYRDAAACTTGDAYIPSPAQMAEAISRFHRSDGCDEICFIHSHPDGYPTLSYADCRFAREFLRLNPQYQQVGMMLVTGGELILYQFCPCREEPVRLLLETY